MNDVYYYSIGQYIAVWFQSLVALTLVLNYYFRLIILVLNRHSFCACKSCIDCAVNAAGGMAVVVVTAPVVDIVSGTFAPTQVAASTDNTEESSS